MLDLRYDNPNNAYTPTGTPTATPQYNGNISQAIWRVRGRERQSYTFQYDFLNRMTEANYAEINNLGAKTNDQNKYMEKLTYDLRGNIKTLQRNGLNTATCGVGLIDNLTYYYADDTNISYSPGNRLKKVFDVSDKTMGFKTQTNNTSLTNPAFLYMYDANGNLKSDPNKNINTIQYNHLNLPTVITFSTGNVISFLYDGSGTKLRKTVSGTENYVQDYVGGIEYKNNVLEAIYHPEGRITTVNGSLKYEYALRDHLGNTRVMFCDRNNDGYITPTYFQETNEVTQENSYYPYGLAMEGYWMNNPLVTDNKYGYNGKELNSDFGLDWNHHDWRFLDLAINRFVTIDPESEEGDQEAWNPYHFGYDNPIRYNDPDGRFPIETIWDVVNVIYDVGAAAVNYIKGDKEAAKSNLKDLAADVAATLIPYVPAGASKLIRGADKAIDMAKAAETVTDGVKKTEKLKESAKTGQEAHRQIQKEIKKLDPGAKIEETVKLKDRTVRKDAVKSDGTAVIIKPDTPSGRRSATKREKLMKDNGHKTETILYNPNNPNYLPTSPTYIGPKRN